MNEAQPSGYRSLGEGLVTGAQWQMQDIQQAVAAERERCAKLIEQMVVKELAPECSDAGCHSRVRVILCILAAEIRSGS